MMALGGTLATRGVQAKRAHTMIMKLRVPISLN